MPNTPGKIIIGTGLSSDSSTNTLKAKLKSDTASALTAASKGSTANREYAVGIDADGNLSVNVPWEGSSGSGHTIQNSAGTDMAARAKLQFLDSTVSDDSTNDKTVVEVIKQITLSQLASQPDGIYYVTDDTPGYNPTEAMIAPAFTTTASYVINDLCIYQNVLYKCTTAHSGAWDASHFTVTTIADERGTGGASSLAELTDTTISSVSDGQILKYNGTSGKWVNADDSGAAVSYNNSSSGLSSTDVQDAIDELAEKKADAGVIPVNPSSTTGLNIWIETE